MPNSMSCKPFHKLRVLLHDLPRTAQAGGAILGQILCCRGPDGRQKQENLRHFSRIFLAFKYNRAYVVTATISSTPPAGGRSGLHWATPSQSG